MGPLIRIVFLAAAVWLAWRIFRALRSRGDEVAKGARPRLADKQDLVECPHCGVHLPRRDAVTVDGLAYCAEGAAERMTERDGE